MSFTVDTLTGLAQILHDAGVATYRPTGGYQAGETGIYFKRPPATPDRCLTLTLYPVASPYTTGLQVRARGNAGAYLDADTLADDAMTVLHGIRGLPLGAITCELIAWQSGASMGIDDEGRDERTDNYHLTTQRPATSLVDVTT